MKKEEKRIEKRESKSYDSFIILLVCTLRAQDGEEVQESGKEYALLFNG